MLLLGLERRTCLATRAMTHRADAPHVYERVCAAAFANQRGGKKEVIATFPQVLDFVTAPDAHDATMRLLDSDCLNGLLFDVIKDKWSRWVGALQHLEHRVCNGCSAGCSLWDVALSHLCRRVSILWPTFCPRWPSPCAWSSLPLRPSSALPTHRRRPPRSHGRPCRTPSHPPTRCIGPCWCSPPCCSWRSCASCTSSSAATAGSGRPNARLLGHSIAASSDR
jgi:hypothetical protein